MAGRLGNMRGGTVQMQTGNEVDLLLAARSPRRAPRTARARRHPQAVSYRHFRCNIYYDNDDDTDNNNG